MWDRWGTPRNSEGLVPGEGEMQAPVAGGNSIYLKKQLKSFAIKQGGKKIVDKS